MSWKQALFLTWLVATVGWVGASATLFYWVAGIPSNGPDWYYDKPSPVVVGTRIAAVTIVPPLGVLCTGYLIIWTATNLKRKLTN